MTNVEKIIKGLEECVGNENCTKCQYKKEKEGALSCKKLLADALELIKSSSEVKMIDKAVVINGLGAIRKFFEISQPSQAITFDSYQNIIDGAISLLKEQEPRVLNWDEVENYSVVYGEFRGVKNIFPLIITKNTSGKILSWNPEINISGEFFLLVSDEEDRRNTRCWNIEPTDEQREVVKWE